MKPIKMWVSPTHATATVACAVHSEQQLISAGYIEGFFITQEELERQLKKAFEAGREIVGYYGDPEEPVVCDELRWDTYADYKREKEDETED